MRGIAQDVRYALRGLRRNPSFAGVAVLTLALGLGANTAVFSVLHAVLLRPLPYASPEQLVVLWSEVPTQGLREGRPAYGDVEEWRRYSQTFADIAVMDPVRPSLSTPDGTEQVRVARVSPNYFSLLGVQPALGRTFSAVEADERQRVAVVSDGFSRARFQEADNAIGRSIVIDGHPSRIVGVMPRDFRFDDTEVWEPFTLFPNWDDLRRARGAGSWFVIGRLRPNVTVEQAQAEMSTIAARLAEESPGAVQRGISVVPLSVHVTGSETRQALWTLTGAVSLVLLMAVANVAGLSLARSAGRQREIAIRSALGASRAHIVRQALVESITLAIIAGAASLIVAKGVIHLVLSLRPANLDRLNGAGLDVWGFACALVLSLFSGALVALAPAITTTGRDLKSGFQDGGRTASSGTAIRTMRGGLVVAEFALALVLLAGAGLLVRSLLNVRTIESGFTTDRVIAMQLASPVSFNNAQRSNYFERVIGELSGFAGVDAAAIASEFFIGGNPEQLITVEGSAGGAAERVRLRRDEVSATFFETVGTPIIRGRAFGPGDRADAPRVVIVNDVMARRLWGSEDPIGKRFKFGQPDSAAPWFTVVGIVGDMRRQGPEREPIAQMFESLPQNPSRLVTLLVRTSTDPQPMMAQLQSAVRSVEKSAAVYGVSTLEERLDGFVAQRRFQTALLVAFSCVALVLAAIGIYSLMRYSVATRMREISIRMAVGAHRRDILQLIIREGLTLSVTGTVLGIAGALSLGQVLSGMVFGVSATDPATLVAVAALLTAVSIIACYVPARRAASANPVSGLKYD